MGGRVRSRRSSSWILAGLVAAAITTAPVAASAQNMGTTAGLGIGSVVCSLVYGPAKLVYAGLGAVVAGSAWALSGGDARVASPILNAAVRGDYVITPEHLQGRRSIEFVGRDPAQQSLAHGSTFEEGF